MIRRSSQARRRPLSSLGGVLLLISAGPGLAETDEAATSVLAADAPPKPGYYLGDLRVRPTISLSARHDDNVFTTAHDTRSDWLLLLSPSVTVDADAEKHRFTLKAGAAVGRYDTYDDENFVDSWLDISGRYELGAQVQISGGVGLKYSHEPRDSQDARIGGLEPTTYRAATANAGVKWRHGVVTYQMGATFETLDFDNVPAIGGTIINSDRDRVLTGLGVRASYRVDPTSSFFAHALADDRRYQRRRDQFGFERDSDGYRLGVGIRKDLGDGDEAEVFVGVLAQDYADSRFSSVERADFGGRLRYSPSQQSTLTLSLQRSLNETTDPGSPGYLHTGLSGRLVRKRTARLQPYLSFGYSESDYLETGREDTQRSLGIGAKYFLSRNTAVTLGYSYLERDANDKGAGSFSNDFDKSQFFVNLTSQLYPFNKSARR